MKGTVAKMLRGLSPAIGWTANIGYPPMSDYETIAVHRRGGAETIELHRPQALNAWNKQFGLDLRAAVDEVGGDDSVRAVCITGAGRAFSSGADLKDLGAR